MRQSIALSTVRASSAADRRRHSAAVVAQLANASLAVNTRKAYACDIELFRRWGGRIPCSAHMVARYAAALATHCAFATISRRINSIGHAHVAINARSPTRHALVRDVVKGIARQIGTAQRQAVPMTRRLLHRVLRPMPLRDLAAVRDRAILLLGFAGAFRRSELAALNIKDIQFHRRGMVIAVRQSKTDQSKEGRVVAIPRSESTLCAVTAIRALLKHHVGDGAELFQCMHRSGAFLGKRLSSAYVSTIVKLRLTAVNVTADGYSGHSLRAGLVTEAAREGVPAWKIRAQTGHGSDVMLARYIRDADIWTDNAAGRVLR